MIEDWFRGILTDGILSNLSGLFDSVNTEVGEIATQVGTTPAGWNAGIFNMIRSLSENVIVPIAGVIITFVMCYELIQLVIEKNNLHDLDTWIFFKWIFKTFVAVLLVTNTWNIVMGVFDITQSVVNDSAGVIISDTSIDIATVITDIEAKLDAMSVGGLLGLWFQSLFVGLTMKALSICIMLVVYGRMIEIYLVTSIAPIPVATMVNHEWGGMGQIGRPSVFYCFRRPLLPPHPDWRGNLRRSRSLSIPNHRAGPLTSCRHRSREYPPGWSSISHANSKVFPIPGLSRHTEPVPTRPNGPHPNPTKARHRIPIVQEKQPPVSDRPSVSSPVCRKQSARKSGVASH